MIYVCVERFDVIDRRGNILGWDGEVNKAKEKGEHKRGGAHTWVPRCRGYCMLRARMMVLVCGCLAAMHGSKAS
jgi:hypothetical protein